jgi:uncharacterized LabA/DUF88 family protein
MDDKKKVIVYVDGFNFYYGLKSLNWKACYWLDFVGFFSSFLKPYQELVEVNYFSARPSDAGKYDRQNRLFHANKCNLKFNLILGKFLKKELKCNSCGSIIHTFEEKETDVRIATKIVSDAYNKRCDIAIIVSADSDLIPPIELIREFNPLQKVYVYFPPDRYSSNLSNLSDSTIKLDGAFSIFKKHILPQRITLPNGYVIERPDKWK